jgi:hypothetical protein
MLRRYRNSKRGKLMKACNVIARVLAGAGLTVTLAIFGTGAAAQQTCAPTQDPNICVTVTSAPSVTYSQMNSPTFVTYVVRINNGASNQLNRVRFSATVTGAQDGFVNPTNGVFSGTPAPYPAPQTGNVTLTCNLTAADAISCPGDGSIGASIPPGQTVEFSLMVNTPTAEGPPIVLNWNSSFAEGSSTSGTANNGTAAGSNSTALTAPGSSVSATLPATGGSLTASSPSFITTATITNAGRITSVSIDQTPDPTGSLCRSFRTCYSTLQTIPGVFSAAPLQFRLQMDASNIKRGTKIDSVDIRYTGTDINGTTFADWPVPQCLTPTTVRPDGLPCISTRTSFRNSRVPGWTPDLDGDFVWQIISTKNGRFDLF